MTGRVLVRPRVSRDIAEIAGFIAADNLGASDRFIEAVYHAFELLAAMPHLGTAHRFRRGILKGLRIWPMPKFEKYLAVYRPLPHGIEVSGSAWGSKSGKASPIAACESNSASSPPQPAY